MRTVLFATLGILVVVIAGVLLVPSVFDWNDYKPEIAEQVRARTGRDLRIDGDISLRLVPSPALVVKDIRLANIDGGVAEDMVRVGFARVDVAFWPLLNLDLDIRRVHLIDPEIVLETLEDGRNNWDLAPAAVSPGAGAPGETDAAAATDGGRTAITLNDLAIENATVTYRDLRDGTVERIEALSATVQAQSLEGPLEAEGSLRVRGIPVGFVLGLGDLRDPTTIPVRLAVRDLGESVRAEINGFVIDPAQAPRFEGEVRAEGDFLSAAIQRLRPEPVPGFLAQPFRIDGTVEAAADAVVVDLRDLRLGDTNAAGTIRAAFAATPVVEIDLAVRRVDLDTWLSMPPARAEGGATAAEGPPPRPDGSSGPDAGGGPVATTALPRDVDVRLAAAVEAIAYRGGVVQGARVNLRLANGEITVNQARATIPGGADVALFGLISAAAGPPRFDGEVDVSALDLRGTLDWVGVDIDDIAPGRLRTFSARGKVRAAADRIEARDLVIGLDDARISGGITAVPGDRPAVGIGLSIDRLDIDDYLPPSRRPSDRATGPGGRAGDTGEGNGGARPGGGAGSPLAAFDADVRLRAGSLGWRGIAATGVVVEGKLIGGDVTLERASVDDLAGASGTVSGRITGLSGRPLLEGVEFRLNVADPARLGRVFDQPLPPAVLALGPVGASGRIDGIVTNPTVDATVTAAQARVRATGQAQLAAGPGFAGRVELQSADLTRLIAILGDGYRPAGPLGPTEIGAQVSLAGDHLAVDDISGSLAGVAVSGRIAVDGARTPAAVTADLTTGNLVVDPFLPAKRQAATVWRLVPAAWSGSRRAPSVRRDGLVPVAVDRRWSRDPIDVSALRDIDAEVAWRSRTVRYGKLTAADVRLTATLAGGLLTVPGLDGSVFGGSLRGSGRLNAAGVPAFDLDLAVDNANLSELAAAGGGGLRSGKFSMATRLAGRGDSEADIVSSLGGDGRMAAVGIDAGADVAAVPLVGPMLNALVQVTTILDRALGGLLGGRSGSGLLDVRGTFTMDRGVAVYDNLDFQAPLYAGRAAGRADLPAWTIETDGIARLDDSKLAGGLLSGVRELPREIRFSARGPLDDPKVRVDTSGFKAVIDAIPGVESLRKQPGVGETLDRLLPGQGSTGGTGTPVPPPVNDLLKGLFR